MSSKTQKLTVSTVADMETELGRASQTGEVERRVLRSPMSTRRMLRHPYSRQTLAIVPRSRRAFASGCASSGSPKAS